MLKRCVERVAPKGGAWSPRLPLLRCLCLNGAVHPCTFCSSV